MALSLKIYLVYIKYYTLLTTYRSKYHIYFLSQHLLTDFIHFDCSKQLIYKFNRYINYCKYMLEYYYKVGFWMKNESIYTEITKIIIIKTKQIFF